ncbi:hypothetical protein ACM66B_005885 [Microbotryomycetes sp. NB124-2]
MSFVTVNAAVNAQWLSGADDLCSRIFLDFCIFDEPKVDGRRTGKMDMRGKAEPRLLDSDLEFARDIVKKLRKSEITAAEATDKLCDKLSYFKTFMNKWDPDDEDLFKVHVKRYCYAMRPDSGIAFHETDRYTRTVKSVLRQANDSPSRAIAKAAAAATANRKPDTFIEVGVFATRSYKKGEVIKLRGGVADLSEEEDDKMREDGGRSDFSVLWSDRKKCFCLLLGPARFVNHDCRNNVVFQLTGSNMAFKVIEDIEIDDEIFTHYGDHYFDMNNARCLCATCQKFKRGAFAKKGAETAKATEPANSTRESPAARKSTRATPASPARSTPTRELAPRRARPRGSLKVNEATRQAFEAKTLAAASAREELRIGPRLPHPRLRPPPGYANCYDYDAGKKSFKYIGPRAKPVKVQKIVVQESPRTSRKRQRDDSPSSPAPVPRKKVTVTRTIQMKPLRLGVRSSRRMSALSTSETAREIAFERLKRALGRYGPSSDEDDLSEVSESESEASSSSPKIISDTVTVEVQLTVPPPDDDEGKAASSSSASPGNVDQEVEALLLQAEAMTPDSPVGERPPSLDPAPRKRERDSESVATGRGSSGSVPPAAPRHPDLSARQFSPTQSPVPEADTEAAAGGVSSGSGGYKGNVTSSHVGAGSGGGIAGGSGGDDPHKRKPPDFEKVDEEMKDVEEQEEDEVDGNERRHTKRGRESATSLNRKKGVRVKVEESEEVTMPLATPLSETGSTARDPDTREAAAFLLMLSSVGPPTLEEPPTPSTSRTSSQAALTNGKQTKRGRNADDTNGKDGKARQASQSGPKTSDKGKGKGKALHAVSSDPPAASSSSNGARVEPKRGTRRSAPIAGNLSDVLRDPSVMNVAGFYDPVLGKYRSRGSLVAESSETLDAARADSSSPRAATPPPARSIADKGKAPARANESVAAAKGNCSDGPASHGAAQLNGATGPAPREILVRSNIRIGKTAVMRRLSAPSSSDSSMPPEQTPAVATARAAEVPTKGADGPSVRQSPQTRPQVQAPAQNRPQPANQQIRPHSANSSLTARSSSSPKSENKPFVRGTRRTAPIESTLAELVSSQQVAAVSGAFDWDTRRYVSRRAASFGGVVVRPPKPVQDGSSDSSDDNGQTDGKLQAGDDGDSDLSDVPDSAAESTPEVSSRAHGTMRKVDKGKKRTAATREKQDTPASAPTTSSSSSSGGNVDFHAPRTSRSRNPIRASLSDLVMNPVVLAATGGWDSETGRYKGIRKRPSAGAVEPTND